MEPENKIKVEEALTNANKERAKYMSKLDDVKKHPNLSIQTKLFYSILNEEIKSVNKNLNMANDLVIKDLKSSAFCKLNNEDSKKLVKALNDHTNARKELNLQISKLKRTLGEVINKRN